MQVNMYSITIYPMHPLEMVYFTENRKTCIMA